MALTPQQEMLIEQQLGRSPRGVVKVAAESNAGVPMVLQMRSWIDNEPFPTLYWLCSKDLHKAIAQIETAGFVKELEQRIEDDGALREQLLVDQQRYCDERAAQMTAEDKQAIADAGFTELFASFGIGGIKQWDKVRCLHMHYAHHLVAGNVIGAILDAEFDLANVPIAL
jgi:hypothetical protein